VTGPIPDSYWVEPQRFAAGEYPGALTREKASTKLSALRDAGVTSFIDLTEQGELEPYEELCRDLRWQRMNIRDMTVPSVAEMRAVIDRIDNELARGEVVYLHCWGGHGRTGTVVGCWLVRHGRSADAALARIVELRQGIPDASHPSPEFPEQRQFVRAWRAQEPKARPANGPD
jgi:protein-tyrosine phosphatase